MSNQADIYKIYLHIKHPYESKYQLLIEKREKSRGEHSNHKKNKLLTALFNQSVLFNLLVTSNFITQRRKE